MVLARSPQCPFSPISFFGEVPLVKQTRTKKVGTFIPQRVQVPHEDDFCGVKRGLSTSLGTWTLWILTSKTAGPSLVLDLPQLLRFSHLLRRPDIWIRNIQNPMLEDEHTSQGSAAAKQLRTPCTKPTMAGSSKDGKGGIALGRFPVSKDGSTYHLFIPLGFRGFQPTL